MFGEGRRGGGGGASDGAALPAESGVNRLLAIHEDPPKPLRWPTGSVSPSVAGPGNNTSRLHTAIIFSVECKHPAERVLQRSRVDPPLCSSRACLHTPFIANHFQKTVLKGSPLMFQMCTSFLPDWKGEGG